VDCPLVHSPIYAASVSVSIVFGIGVILAALTQLAWEVRLTWQFIRSSNGHVGAHAARTGGFNRSRNRSIATFV
jgi:hypothetical protein